MVGLEIPDTGYQETAVTRDRSMAYPLPANLPPVNHADNTWQVIAGRAAPEHRQVIDMAAAKLGQRRSHFLIQAAIDKALEVLGADGVAA